MPNLVQVFFFLHIKKLLNYNQDVVILNLNDKVKTYKNYQQTIQKNEKPFYNGLNKKFGQGEPVSSCKPNTANYIC